LLYICTPLALATLPHHTPHLLPSPAPHPCLAPTVPSHTPGHAPAPSHSPHLYLWTSPSHSTHFALRYHTHLHRIRCRFWLLDAAAPVSAAGPTADGRSFVSCYRVCHTRLRAHTHCLPAFLHLHYSVATLVVERGAYQYWDRSVILPGCGLVNYRATPHPQRCGIGLPSTYTHGSTVTLCLTPYIQPLSPAIRTCWPDVFMTAWTHVVRVRAFALIRCLDTHTHAHAARWTLLRFPHIAWLKVLARTYQHGTRAYGWTRDDACNYIAGRHCCVCITRCLQWTLYRATAYNISYPHPVAAHATHTWHGILFWLRCYLTHTRTHRATCGYDRQRPLLSWIPVYCAYCHSGGRLLRLLLWRDHRHALLSTLPWTLCHRLPLALYPTPSSGWTYPF